MKQDIKKLLFLFIMIFIFNSSQEKPCTGKLKCAAAPLVVERNSNDNSAADIENELPVMPISKFILLQ